MALKKKTQKAPPAKSSKKAPPKPAPARKAVASSRPPSRTNGKNGAAAAPPKAVKPAPESKIQLTSYEKAIHLFRSHQFAQAREWFQRAAQGPSREIKANAELHIRMCERRLEAPPPAPRSLEEHYTYGVALINARDLGEARKHLESALKLDPRADHVHYALGVCLALSGDLSGAYDSLKRAIELQPRNRMAARHDSDLEEVGRRQPLLGLLHTGG